MSAGCCDELREGMVAHICRELHPLGVQRLEAHMGHCHECAALHHSLRDGLSVARGWVPQIDQEHQRRLQGGLVPYVLAENARRRARTRVWRLSLAALATACVSMALAVVMLWRNEETRALSGVVAAPIVSGEATLPGEVMERWTPKVLSPHVRVMHSHAWDGRVDSEGRVMTVTMSRGAAVFSFEGGQGRRLQISTVGALVEVVGTRFSVESDPQGTRVAVAEGVVRVLTLSGERRLHRGGSRWLCAVMDRGSTTQGRILRYLSQRWMRPFSRDPLEALMGRDIGASVSAAGEGGSHLVVRRSPSQ